MALQTTNPKSWSVAKFVVAVLWMEGRLGPADIAKQVKWTPGQVRGFYDREFKPPRAQMTREERQEILTYLRGWSGWFGVFIDSRFEDRFHAKELQSEKRSRLDAEAEARAKEAKENPREPTKKELRKLAADEAARDKQEEVARLEREFGYAPRGADVDALGWLYVNALGDRHESLAKGAMMSRDRRREAMLKFRMHLAGRNISPLKAQDYEAAGGGGGPKLTLPEYRKFCIDTIGGIREILPAPMFLMVETIVDQDEFVWLRAPKGERRSVVYDAIRFSADTLAVYYQMLARDDFETRWGEKLPETTIVASRAAARADSELTQDIVDQLTRAVA